MKRTILLLVSITFLLTGCKKNNVNPSEELVQWNISKVEGPTTGLVNETISFDVYCPASSGCDYISEFSSDENGDTIVIKALGGTLKDSPCTMAAVPILAKYEFKTSNKGLYTLKFISRDNTIIEHIVTIQ